jgi:CDGSH-type Zn-finger protein
MSDHSFRIKINENGCYTVTGVSKMTEIERVVNEQGSAVDWKHGKEFDVKEKMNLCRCGQSKNKPYCDGTHNKIGFTGELLADREERETREAVYGGNGITMTDDESLCAGYEFCDRFGSVWRMMKISENPRIKERIKRQVSLCPTGRLQYILPGSENPEEIHYEPSIDAVKDGPLLALGNIPVEAPDGFVYEVRNRQALCRCGQSGNMPFCDGTHWKNGFKSE